MATLTPTLTLTSSDTSTDALALSVTDALTVGVPMTDTTRVEVTTTGADTIIIPNLDARRYLYVKHTGVDAAGATVSTDIKVEEGDENWFSRLAPGEFLFVPLNAEPTQLIQLETTGGTIVAEYAYWTKA
jgi:hypothetical protein